MARTKKTDPIDPVRVRLVTAAAAMEFGVPDLQIDRPDQRGPGVDFARQVAMYLSTCFFGMTATRVGELFKRDRSTVSYAVRVIEASRIDPVFDAKLARLEEFLVGAPA